MTVRKWGLKLSGDGKTAVAGRLAEVTYDDQPLHGVRDIVLRCPLDGVAVLQIEVLASDVNVDGLIAENIEVAVVPVVGERDPYEHNPGARPIPHPGTAPLGGTDKKS